MAHVIEAGPHPNIVIMHVIGNTTSIDMDINTELCLNKGQPVYLLVDLSNMTLGLPENFLNDARHSAIVQPNMIHAAIYVHSSLIKSIVSMIVRITYQNSKLSIHDQYDQALAQLQKLVKEAGL